MLIVNGQVSLTSGDMPATNTRNKYRSNYTLLQILQAYITNTSPLISYITQLSDFPTPVAGVITLEDNKTYIVITDVDLLGNRIVCGQDNVIMGFSSENCSLTSTGLSFTDYLITSDYTCVLKDISILDVTRGVYFDGIATVMALDWTGVNFENVNEVGVIKDVNNFIFSTGAFINAEGITFSGNANTIAFGNCLFSGANIGNIITLDSTLIVSRRFRIIYSSFISLINNTAIYVDPAVTIPTESYILDTVNFAGSGDYTVGLDYTSNTSLFVNCVGISNTVAFGQEYIVDNLTATTVSSSNTFYKVAGTFIDGGDNSKFTATDARLTCNAKISRKYLIQANLSFTSGNNNVCEFGIFVSPLANICVPSKIKSTANTSGRAENITITCVTTLTDNQYVEIHCANLTGANNITVTDCHFIVTEIH